jgi:tetratricopeptide (TPR) repeat protein
LVVGLLALAGSSCSPQAKKARLLEQANRNFDSGLYDRAEIEYLNVLRLEAVNPQAISQLGLIYFNQGRVGRAFPFLLKGRELRPENLKLRLKLGMLFLSTGKVKEARNEAIFILDRQPQDAEAPLLLAESAAKPTDIDEIRRRLQNLPAPAPDTAPVQVALGFLDLRENHLSEAETAFKRAQTLDPKLSTVYTALGSLFLAQKNLPQGDEALKKAAELSGPRSPNRLKYAQFKVQTGDLVSAKRLLTEMTENTPDYLPAWLWLAEIAAAEKKYDESAAFVARVLARDATQPEAMLMSGRLCLAKGEPGKAIAEFEKMRNAYPQAPQVHYQLGLAYLANGDNGQAIASLNQALALAPDSPDAILLLAGINIRKGNLSTALVALKQLVQKRPEISQARLLLADAYRGQGNLDDALDVYRQLEKNFPKNPQAPWLTGLMLLQLNRRADARQAFDRALTLVPDYLPAAEQLVNLDLSDKQYSTAHERVAAQIAKNPKRAGPLLLLAKVYLAQHDSSQAETTLRKAIELEPAAPTAYFLLAQLYVGSNQHEKALANLQEVLLKNPKDLTALMLTGVIHDQQKDYAAAREYYEKLLALNPRFGPALNNLAWLYSEHLEQLEKANEMARRARDLSPYEPHAADTLGWILYRQRKYPAALSLIEESAGKMPDDADIQYHLGLTHYMMGEEDSARIALQRALQLNKDFAGKDEVNGRLAILNIDVKTPGPETTAALERAVAEHNDDPVALARLATVYEKRGLTDKAIAAWESALATSPNDLRALTNLARLYIAQKQVSKALELVKTARKLAPDNPDVAYALGRLAYQTGDFRWAVSLLDEVARNRPDDPEALFDFANAAYSVGRVSDAETAMRRALQINPSFPRAPEAGGFLEMLALAANPSPGAASETKIEQALKADPGSVPALMAMAAVNQQKPDVNAARENYEKALVRYPEFAPATRRLAILYAANPGGSQKAYDLATKARETYPDDPELAKAFGIIVYRQGDFARAASLLKDALKRSSGDAELMYYLGMAQHSLKQNADSRESLQRALAANLRADLAAEARRILAEK